MPSVIIIRLRPDERVAGTDFTSYLAGLIITAYGSSCADTNPDLATAAKTGKVTHPDRANINFPHITRTRCSQHPVLIVDPSAEPGGPRHPGLPGPPERTIAT